MTKKFNVTKPHTHICNKCRGEIYCRAKDCSYNQYLDQCSDCQQGWQYRNVEGSLVKQREIPSINKVNRMFP